MSSKGNDSVHFISDDYKDYYDCVYGKNIGIKYLIFDFLLSKKKGSNFKKKSNPAILK